MDFSVYLHQQRRPSEVCLAGNYTYLLTPGGQTVMAGYIAWLLWQQKVKRSLTPLIPRSHKVAGEQRGMKGHLVVVVVVVVVDM
jgi:hypothetical protein